MRDTEKKKNYNTMQREVTSLFLNGFPMPTQGGI